jgi:hypothetical protein
MIVTSTPRRVGQRPAHPRIGNEVGVGDLDRRARRFDGQQEEQVGLGGAAGRRALDRLDGQVAARPERREIGIARQQQRGGLPPVLDEGGLQRAHDGALDTHVGLAPVSFATPVARPLLADAGAAREPDAAVDDEDTSMVAVVDAPDRERPDRVIAREGAAGGSEGPGEWLRHPAGADGVHEHVDADAGPAALGQRLDDLAGDVTVLPREVRERDGRARPADRRQHRGEDLVAVDEHRGAIAVDEARQRVGLDGPDEGGVADRHVRRDVVGPAQRTARQGDAEREGGEPGHPHSQSWSRRGTRGR